MQPLDDFLDRVTEGDCLEILPGVPSGSIHLVLSDLPYGTTTIPWDKVIDMTQLWKEYERIIIQNGAVVLSTQGAFTGKVILSNPRLFKYKIVWIKSSATNFLNGKKQPLRRHEDICVFYRNQPTYHPQLQRGAIRVQNPKKKMFFSDSQGDIKPLDFVTRSRDRYPHDVVFFEEEETILDVLQFKNAAAEGKIFHPTQKPLALARYLIRTFTNQGDIVLDNACGSGTFLVAAVMEHRRFIGIEKNEDAVHLQRPVDYVQISLNRIKEAIRWRKDEDIKLSLF